MAQTIHSISGRLTFSADREALAESATPEKSPLADLVFEPVEAAKWHLLSILEKRNERACSIALGALHDYETAVGSEFKEIRAILTCPQNNPKALIQPLAGLPKSNVCAVETARRDVVTAGIAWMRDQELGKLLKDQHSSKGRDVSMLLQCRGHDLQELQDQLGKTHRELQDMNRQLPMAPDLKKSVDQAMERRKILNDQLEAMETMLFSILEAISQGEMGEPDKAFMDGAMPLAWGDEKADFMKASESLLELLDRYNQRCAEDTRLKASFGSFAQIGDLDIKKLILGDLNQERCLYLILKNSGYIIEDGDKRMIDPSKRETCPLECLRDGFLTIKRKMVAGEELFVAEPTPIAITAMVNSKKSSIHIPACSFVLVPVGPHAKMQESTLSGKHSRSSSLGKDRKSPGSVAAVSGFSIYKTPPIGPSEDNKDTWIPPIGLPALAAGAPRDERPLTSSKHRKVTVSGK